MSYFLLLTQLYIMPFTKGLLLTFAQHKASSGSLDINLI